MATSTEKQNGIALVTEGKNPRGIPSAKFIESVETFLEKVSPEISLGALNELYSKYKYMETSFERSKNIYKAKIPELERTVEIIKILKVKSDDNEEMITNYSLYDTIYSKAKIDTSSQKICLWIGANTMVEYNYDEAIELLSKQLVQTHAKMSELDEDLNHLKANSITVEVNMARIFNYTVKQKKLLEQTKQTDAVNAANVPASGISAIKL